MLHTAIAKIYELRYGWLSDLHKLFASAERAKVSDTSVIKPIESYQIFLQALLRLMLMFVTVSALNIRLGKDSTKKRFDTKQEIIHETKVYL